MENMDRLDVIFALQKSLDEDIMKRRNLNYSYEEWMQKDALACIEEIMEVLNEVQYKWWKNKKPQDEKAIQEELVDVLGYAGNAWYEIQQLTKQLCAGYRALQKDIKRKDQKLEVYMKMLEAVRQENKRLREKMKEANLNAEGI